MVANNSGTAAEVNKQKRVYGQLQWFPTQTLSFTLGGDYAAYDDERTDGTTLNAFAGYQTGAFRFGVEGFVNRITVAEATPTGEDKDDRAGVSIFGAARLAEAWEVVARFDQVERNLRGTEGSESFIVGGVAYRPHANVRFIPNVLLTQQSEDEEALVNGRITLEVTF
jgi:hypothetical protein